MLPPRGAREPLPPPTEMRIDYCGPSVEIITSSVMAIDFQGKERANVIQRFGALPVDKSGANEFRVTAVYADAREEQCAVIPVAIELQEAQPVAAPEPAARTASPL